MKVLFVCRGNVGRSQMAEMLFNQAMPGAHSVSSAGTEVAGHEGELLGEIETASHIIAVLKEVGLDASKNVRRQLLPEMFKAADLVVILDRNITVNDFEPDGKRIIRWDVEDPFRQSLEFTRKMRDEIAANIANLISQHVSQHVILRK